MKKKLALALVISLVMLVTVATPVLAGNAAKGDLVINTSNESASKATYTLQVTKNNDLKITLVIRGATANKTYEMTVWYRNSPTNDYVVYSQTDVTTDKRGNLRYSGIVEGPFVGYCRFKLELVENAQVGVLDCFESNEIKIRFKQ